MLWEKIGKVWGWLGNKDNRERLAFLGVLFGAPVAAAWAAYVHFNPPQKQQEPQPMPPTA